MHGCPGLPLRTACFLGNIAIVRELLTHGANPNTTTQDGPGAPLRLALRRNHREVIILLLQQGAAIPEGVTIDPALLAAAAAKDTIPGAVVAPVLPEDKRPDNLIEFSPSGISFAPPVDDALGDVGTDTQALGMELLFEEDDSLRSVSKKGNDQR